MLVNSQIALATRTFVHIVSESMVAWSWTWRWFPAIISIEISRCSTLNIWNRIDACVFWAYIVRLQGTSYERIIICSHVRIGFTWRTFTCIACWTLSAEKLTLQAFRIWILLIPLVILSNIIKDFFWIQFVFTASVEREPDLKCSSICAVHSQGNRKPFPLDICFYHIGCYCGSLSFLFICPLLLHLLSSVRPSYISVDFLNEQETNEKGNELWLRQETHIKLSFSWFLICYFATAEWILNQWSSTWTPFILLCCEGDIRPWNFTPVTLQFGGSCKRLLKRIENSKFCQCD